MTITIEMLSAGIISRRLLQSHIASVLRSKRNKKNSLSSGRLHRRSDNTNRTEYVEGYGSDADYDSDVWKIQLSSVYFAVLDTA